MSGRASGDLRFSAPRDGPSSCAAAGKACFGGRPAPFAVLRRACCAEYRAEAEYASEMAAARLGGRLSGWSTVDGHRANVQARHRPLLSWPSTKGPSSQASPAGRGGPSVLSSAYLGLASRTNRCGGVRAPVAGPRWPGPGPRCRPEAGSEPWSCWLLRWPDRHRGCGTRQRRGWSTGTAPG